ncbi:hypothetical protein COT75_03205 [Candidatus Beckwithbacteria bacterium CG10_big_fil_rev_8_21_14_0_10_34_10]|uniref:Uncharacterized protein n=1 Tax=Candidatus Beckwithbacteria bacterium CG10_big_fil_rev_8_21_14_0_10_34_10 TaxID=1974495 RepID=A0A2H0W8V6_9BACT|nr:MAG: hypothetical protein COT75_03205 [Candidatus Beckwithbacteria bacterium CG10_big_fil_rev_8_21_14_0_10_34_10]
MELEKLEVLGVDPDYIRYRDNEVNPSRQSFMLGVGEEEIMMVRPLIKEFSGLERKEEIERRDRAIKWHQENLPKNTLDYQLLVIEGRDEIGEKVALLGRWSPEMKRVESISGLPYGEILTNGDLCGELGRIFEGYLRALVMEGKVFDYGRRGKENKSLTWPFSFFSQMLVSNNIMVGENASGRQVFCDPDFYMTVKEHLMIEGIAELPKRAIGLIKKIARLGLGCFFYQWVSALGGIETEEKRVTVKEGVVLS